jgi:hypothetical protein
MGLQCDVASKSVNGQQKNSDRASLQNEMACQDCSMTTNQPEASLKRAGRILHHVQWQHLALLPPHAVVVNTTRDPVIDEQALYEVLRTGRLAAAALDVLQPEPPVENVVFNAYLHVSCRTYCSPRTLPGTHSKARESYAARRQKRLAASCMETLHIMSLRRRRGVCWLLRSSVGKIGVLRQT